ncbi:MAG: SRPBCC family protein [Bdellovibrionales bacterium]|nr:SRPBCC family protein [Bdellovibrionales bacterium]
MRTNATEENEVGEFGSVVGPAMVRIQRLLSGSPEVVWEYLTQSEKCSQWLATIDGALEVGAQITLTFNNSTLTPHNEETPEEFKKHECSPQAKRILVYEPPHKLTYTWGSQDNPSEVTFELEAQGEKTLLTVTHAKLPNRDQLLGVSSGWHSHLNVLRAKLAGDTPEPFWPAFLKVRKEYERAIESD